MNTGIDTPNAPPRSGLEHHLVGIWAEVLTVDPVGIDDNFLELDGDSLRAVAVADRILLRFSREIPLSLIFDSPTIASLARARSNAGNPAVQGNCGTI